MVEKILAKSVRLMFVGGVAIAAMSQIAMAQEATPDTSVQRIEITGSSIKRLAAETSLPVTTIKATDFAKQGLTTAEQVLNSLASNQSSQGGSQSVGASTGGESQADLRGIGSNKTLVLLNGRRLATHPYDGATVDLNIIPIGALDRVEVLRDGASAIYGTDAIGGVINFITKRSVKSVEISAEATAPQSAGGGEGRFNVLAGMGDLDVDGYNIFAVVDAHKQKELTAVQRSFSQTGVIPTAGLNKTSGNTPSANYYDNGSGKSGNITYATGCDPTNHSTPSATSATCRYDYSSQVDDLPETQQVSFFGKGSFKLNADHTASIEYLHSQSDNTNSIAAAPLYDGESPSLTGLQVPVGSKYYPGGPGGVPAVAGLTGPLSINWRPLEIGKRQEKDTSKSDRFLAALEGTLGAWDYKTGFTYTKAEANSDLINGYATDAGIMKGVTTGILNPFGPQDAAGTAYLQSIKLTGNTLTGTTKATGVDFKASREFGELAGGAMGVAFGAEYRKEDASYDVNYAVATQASSTGLATAQSITGSRNVGAVFSEFDAPLTKQIDVQLAGRVDNYSDVGSTFNPKIGIRYQPTEQLLFRGSANTGFRAPTLYEKNAPNSVGNSANDWNDPILCPGGVALPGRNPSVVCNAQQNLQAGGNKNLTPEKAKNFTFGLAFEPTRALTLTVDYWNIHITDSIGVLPETTIFGNPTKYANLFVRNADGSLAYVIDTNQNLGDTKTDGIDVTGTWRLPETSVGKFVVGFDGTYVNSYEYQNEKGGAFTQNVGTYADNGPVFRWKHNLTFQWIKDAWSVSLTERFLSGYHDQNNVAPQFMHDVSPYSLWNVTTTYTGFKHWTLIGGVKNIFNTNPPFTNQGTVFAQGYDPRFTDPVGRALYLRGTYKF